VGDSFAAQLVGDLQKIVGGLILLAKARNKKSYNDTYKTFREALEVVFNFGSHWGLNILKHNRNSREDLDLVMDEFTIHLGQINNQIKIITDNLFEKNDFEMYNIINALKDTRHLEEIFGALKQNMRELFKLGVKYGYDSRL
jgi:hypothetical protein